MMISQNPRDICKSRCPFTYETLTVHLEHFFRQLTLPLVVADVFDEPWVGTWAGFTEACDFIIARGWLGEESVHCADPDYFDKLHDLIARLCMLVLQNKDVAVQSDEVRLQELKMHPPGLIVAAASGEGCNCLVDSLITVLQHKGYFKDMTPTERSQACKANRRSLNNHPDDALHPVDRDDNGVSKKASMAYLEHDVHAEPSVHFLFRWFRLHQLLVENADIPEAGFKITVFSRADVADFIPPTVKYICRGGGADADACELFLYNRLNERLRGVHYEPLLTIGVEGHGAEAARGAGAGEGEEEGDDAGKENENKEGKAGEGEGEGKGEEEEAGDEEGAGEYSCMVPHWKKGRPCVSAVHGCGVIKFAMNASEDEKDDAESGSASETKNASADEKDDEESESASESEASNDAADICTEVRTRDDLPPVEMDIVQQRCAALRKHMRQRPDLPCNDSGEPLSMEDIDAGKKLALYTCPYVLASGASCRFATNDREMYLHHICGGVKDKAKTHVAVLAEICPPDIPWMDTFTYVHEAMAIAERERWPLRGLSTTRRSLDLLAVRYNDKTIKCLCCFICAQLRTTCSGYAHVQ